MKLNFKIIFYFFGLLLLFNGGFILLSVLVSFLYRDGVTFELLFSGLVVLLAGGLLMVLSRAHTKVMVKREGYVVVTFGWIVMAISGALPYLATGVIPSFTSAFF